ncbi:MAG: hypothetical protein ACTFAL_00680 [Candidatus Electronema sp. V4]|uniref:hypothetical protein n=1 Tax=Candidatus Electronema sp. V4 TaxID=3454756 RepID=UPI0040557FB4
MRLTEFSHGCGRSRCSDGLSPGSAVIKVHLDGTGALKKWRSAGRQILRRMDSETASDSRIR